MDNKIDESEDDYMVFRFTSFKYKAKITGNTPINNNTLGTKVAFSLIYLIHFCRSLIFPLINKEIELYLSLLR